MLLIRVQSLVRGFIARRKFKVHKIYSESTQRYFKHEEAQETLSDRKYEVDSELRVATHSYKTGSVYEG